MNTISISGLGLGLCMILPWASAQGEVAEEAWVAHYDGPGNGKDNAQALAVDAAGNTYVTGFSDGGDENYDFATIKYDADGNALWVTRYDGQAKGADWARDVAVDAEGDVYVTGSSAGEATGFDFVTVKYDAEGNELWVSRYDGPFHGDDKVKALALDATGNVYATGDSAGPGGRAEAVTIKYGPDGDLLWAVRSDAPEGDVSFADIAVDTGGNVYVTGMATLSHGNADFVAVKYDPMGNALWTAHRDWSVHDDARYLVVDEEGNAYAAGEVVRDVETSDTEAHQDIAVVKYSPDGTEVWSASFDGGEGSNDVTSALQLHPAGGVAILGTSLPSADGSRDVPAPEYVTNAYDPDGNPLWAARYQGFRQGVSMAQGLALDTSGNAFVLASSRGIPDRAPELTLIKYGVQGQQLWVAHGNGLATAATSNLSTDSAGSIWIIGSDRGGRDYLTARYLQSDSPETLGTSTSGDTPAIR